jgi:hypothetical protein
MTEIPDDEIESLLFDVGRTIMTGGPIASMKRSEDMSRLAVFEECSPRVVLPAP